MGCVGRFYSGVTSDLDCFSCDKRPLIPTEKIHKTISLPVKFLVLVATLFYHTAIAQIALNEKAWVEQLDLNAGLPPNLLNTRSAVFYVYTLTTRELETIQQSFQRTGIDAVSYFELDKLTAGKDIIKAFANYLLKREIDESDIR